MANTLKITDNKMVTIWMVEPTLTAKQIDNRIRKLDAIKAQIKELEKEADDLKAQIVNGMGGDTFTTPHFEVRNTPYQRSVFDTKALKAEHPELAEKYTALVDAHRFSYKAI